MTGNIFLDCVFIFFICYGLACMFCNVSDFLLRHYCKTVQKAFILLPLKHESKTLECDIRCAVAKSLNNKCALMILCENLDADEYTMVWRLTDCYDHVIVSTQEEFPDKIEKAQAINGIL